MKATFRVDPDEDEITLAAVLRRHLPALAWSQARRLCERGKVVVDRSRQRDPAMRVRAGQSIAVDETAPSPIDHAMVQIVYEDAHVVVIDKPSGVSSVPYEKREGGTAMDLLREAWKRKGRPSTTPALHVVHRIDKETSGLLAFAKSKAAERGLGELFRTHAVERTYLCVVHGALTDRRIETRLVVDRGDGLRGSTHTPGQGKRAVTHVRVVERFPLVTLCEVRLETGKTHQIRIHLAEGGHPLVGERVYIRDYLKKGHDPIASERLLLHAATLGFTHPLSGQPVALESPLPQDFRAALGKLKR